MNKLYECILKKSAGYSNSFHLKTACSGVFLIALFSCVVFAQHNQTTSPAAEKAKAKDTSAVVELDKIVVTATRLNTPLMKSTGAATIVTDKSIKTMPRAIAVDEAVGLVPGVRVDNQANGSRVHMSIRGQGILSERGLRGIKVLLDDISLNDPTGFVSDLYDIDWETVDRIEVLRGPAAAIYGCASNAGVLNITTQKGEDKPFGGMAYESNGSNGFWKILGQADGSKDNYNYRLSASHTQGYGYRVHQAFRGEIISLKQIWTPSPEVTIMPIVNFSNYFNQNAEGLSLSQLDHPKQANSDAIPFNEYLKTTKFTGGLVAKTALAENHSLDIDGFLRSTDFKEANNRYVDYRTILAPGGSLQYNWDIKGSALASHLTLGTDLQGQTMDETKNANLSDPDRTEKKGETKEDLVIGSAVLANQAIDQFGAGVFLQERLDLGDKFSLMGNVRYDYIKNKLSDNMQRPDDSLLSGEAIFDKVTGRVGASFSLIEALNFFASWGLGFLPPCTEELASNPASYGGFNKNLKPSESNGEEIGVRGSILKRLYYELTGFTLFTENDFYRYRILPARPQETFYGNAGGSERYGIETFVSATPIDPLDIQVAYTYSHFKYTSPDSIEGNWLPNSPRHQLNAQIDYRFLKYFSVQANALYQSLWYIYTDAHNADIHQEGFTLFNARLGCDWKIGTLAGDISFSMKNIADKMWIAFTEPDLDDNGGPNNSYQPGPGREFFVNLRVRY